MPNLLIIANCPSPNTRKLFNAATAGAEQVDGITIRACEPLHTDADAVLWADGIVLGTTENFGYMSGLIKDFFERIYYPCLEKTEGLPVAVYVKGGLDGQGAKASLEKILRGLRWKLVQEVVVLRGEYRAEFAEKCRELGIAMAAGLEAGVW